MNRDLEFNCVDHGVGVPSSGVACGDERDEGIIGGAEVGDTDEGDVAEKLGEGVTGLVGTADCVPPVTLGVALGVYRIVGTGAGDTVELLPNDDP
jgi:hypothetical protein